MRSTLFPLAATTAVQLLASMALVTVPVLAPVASADVGVSPGFVGFFIALSYGASMITSLVSGALVLRYGAIRQSQACLVLCAAGLACVAGGQPALLLAGALLIGSGYGPITPASSHILAKTTPPSMMSLVFSVKQTGVPLGGAAAGALVPPLVLYAGWRFAAVAVAIACIVAAFLAQPLRRSLDADREPSRRLSIGSAATALRFALRDAMLRRLALCSFCFSGIQLCLITYLVTYLTSKIGFSLVAAGLMLSVAQVGGVVARVAWGAIADRSGRPMRLLGGIAAGMGLGAIATAAFSPASAIAWITVVCAFFGATAIGWNGVFLAQVARFAPPGQASIATAGTLFFTYGGVLLGPTMFALLVEAGLGYAAAFVIMAIPSSACAAWLLWRDLDAKPVAATSLEKA
ncbi:MAG TPA: MFS transporter [Usitatibacter sp.]|nr:MFS transporter [Usitatibacter sp.]